MPEQEHTPEELESFRAEFREAAEAAAFVLASGQEGNPLEMSPFSLGISDETVGDLAPDKKTVVRNELYKMLDIKDGETQPINKYEIPIKSAEGHRMLCSVFEGKVKNDDGSDIPVYLHETLYTKDGSLNWELANADEPL